MAVGFTGSIDSVNLAAATFFFNLAVGFCDSVRLVVPGTTFPPASAPTHHGAAESNSKPTKSGRAPHRPARDLEASRRRAEAPRSRAKRKGEQLQLPAAVVAKKSSPAAAAGVPAMITRSKLVEQLRDYQIRSQHK
jgi:hypothetical protein